MLFHLFLLSSRFIVSSRFILSPCHRQDPPGGLWQVEGEDGEAILVVPELHRPICGGRDEDLLVEPPAKRAPPFWRGKSTISMAIFNSYVTNTRGYGIPKMESGSLKWRYPKMVHFSRILHYKLIMHFGFPPFMENSICLGPRSARDLWGASWVGRVGKGI